MRSCILALLFITATCAAPMTNAVVPHRISANPEMLISPDYDMKPSNKLDIKKQFIRLDQNESPFVKVP